MSTTPTVYFPDTIPFGSHKLGRIYYEEYTSGTFKQWFDVTDLVMIDLSDIRADTHISPETGLPHNVMAFPNGVSVQLRFYCVQEGGVSLLRCAVGHDLNGVWNQLPAPRNEVSLGPNYRVLDAAVNGVKVSYNIEYPTVTPVPGVTESQAFTLYMFAPYSYYDEGSLKIQTWGHIVSDVNYQRTYRGGTPVDYDNGTSLMYDHPGTYPVGFYSWDNLDQLEAILNAIKPLDGIKIYGEPTNPDEPSQDDNTSEPGGGGGTGGKQTPGKGGGYDPKSDPMDFPALPTHGSIDSGAVKTFSVSNAILTSLFQKLWDASILDVATWQKLTNAPLDSLVSLQCVPVKPTVLQTGDHIWLGSFDSGIDAPLVTKQYYQVDCGTCKIDEFFGSALDYTNTRVEIYLPFIGIRELETSDVMNMTLAVKYNYDILTGDMVANIKCGKSVLYKFVGSSKCTIPVSAVTNTMLEQFMRSIPQALGSMGGGPTGAGAGLVGMAVNTVLAKRIVARSGDLSGGAGILDEFTPYIILHRPMQSLAATMRNSKGYRSNISATLSSLTGYTEVEYIHLTGISGATDTELEEIETLLKEGVIL